MSLPAAFDHLRLPVIGSPLFTISGPELVIAQCKAGIVGAFPALNARPEPVLDEWLHQITEELAAWDRAHPEAPSAPYAVNQIVHKTNNRLEHDMQVIEKWKPKVVITSLGAVPEVYQAVKSWGGVTLHDVIDQFFAHKAIDKGADGLIPVAAGAGGHAGQQSPFAIVRELREWFDGPIALSGAIASGWGVLAAQACGADLAYIGTAFIATHEARSKEDYRNMIVANAAGDIVYSDLFSGVHGNYLAPSVSRAGLDPKDLPKGDKSKMNFNSGGNQSVRVWTDIYGGGQGIGSVKAVVGTQEFVDRLADEYEEAKRELAAKLAPYTARTLAAAPAK
jgi:nitronate monooxygenase